MKTESGKRWNGILYFVNWKYVSDIHYVYGISEICKFLCEMNSSIFAMFLTWVLLEILGLKSTVLRLPQSKRGEIIVVILTPESLRHHLETYHLFQSNTFDL